METLTPHDPADAATIVAAARQIYPEARIVVRGHLVFAVMEDVIRAR